jgi:hypothetical protein
MLVPPYLALMILTVISNEDFVNIGWDSAGVTTGPVTVPLVLVMGLPMPQVTTGQGTGLRDKLGLIRIALPARKDVVFVVVSDHEATDVLDSLADIGRLDRIGAGFIYESPVVGGVINNLVIRGQRHSASIKQIIMAIDELKESTEWRKRALGGDEMERRRRCRRGNHQPVALPPLRTHCCRCIARSQ